MKKKFLVSLGIILCLILSFSICLANDDIGTGIQDAADGVRNFVGGAEDTIENAAMDVSNVSKDFTGDIANDMNNNSQMNGNEYSASDSMGSSMDDGYTATRTSTGDTGFLGMNSTAWTWIILGIAAIAIIAVVWYYSMQFTNNNHNGDE